MVEVAVAGVVAAVEAAGDPKTMCFQKASRPSETFR
jgi:hypothetical protein